MNASNNPESKMMADYDFTKAAGIDDEEIAAFEETVQGVSSVSDYIVFVTAIDVYFRHLEEQLGKNFYADPMFDGTTELFVAQKGMALLRKFTAKMSDTVRSEIKQVSNQQALLNALEKALRQPMTPQGLATRALYLHMSLRRGNPVLLKAIFGNNQKLRLQTQTAIQSSADSNTDAALEKLASIQVQEPLLRTWIDDASAIARPLTEPPAAVIDPAQQAVNSTMNAAQNINAQNQIDATVTSDKDQASQVKEEQAISIKAVQEQATQAAQSTLEKNGEEDKSVKTSDVIGISTAVATAVVANTDVPETLKGLDPEQRAAALTSGRVQVAAGAGSGKSRTLVARIGYLVKDKGVNPNSICAMSFSRRAADELREKVAQLIGAENVTKTMGAKGAFVSTIHSLAINSIKKYGDSSDLLAFGSTEISVDGENRFKGNGFKNEFAMYAALSYWQNCYTRDWFNTRDPSAKEADKWKQRPEEGRMGQYHNIFYANNMKTEAEIDAWGAKLGIVGKDEFIQAKKLYLLMEGFKGAQDEYDANGKRTKKFEDTLPCKDRAAMNPFQNFRSTWINKPGQKRVGAFDEMLTVLLDILKENPKAREEIQGQYKHLMVDECQDLNPIQSEIIGILAGQTKRDDEDRSFWMVGDDKQCVASDTLIATPEGVQKASSLHEGASILSFRNGEIKPQIVKHVKPSSWSWGYKITTESGKTLTMSPNHKIWATDPVLEEGQMIVYLLYRRDMGFRIGVTNKSGSGEEYLNRFGDRPFMEKAERLWVLDVCDNREDALFKEELYSLKYGVPTMCFNGENRDLNQNRINDIFQGFGKNGGKILEEKNLSFDLPHWMSRSYSKHEGERRTIQMIAHSISNTQIILEWKGNDLDDKLSSIQVTKTSKGTNKIRKYFSSYRDALTFAEELQTKTNANLCRRLSVPDENPLNLLTASALFQGMKVAVREDSRIVTEEIISIEKVEGLMFVDIDVDDASNFFGGDILSHNSIYGFRGSDPSVFMSLPDEEYKKRQITTNYRCAPEFVNHAGKLISHNVHQIPMVCQPNPQAKMGNASLDYSYGQSTLSYAQEIALKLQSIYQEQGAAALSERAVLARTNAEVDTVASLLAILGVPYVRKNAPEVINSKEVNIFTSWLKTVMSQDPGEVLDSFLDVVKTSPKSKFVSKDIWNRVFYDFGGPLGKRLAKESDPISALLSSSSTSPYKDLRRNLAVTFIPKLAKYHFDIDGFRSSREGKELAENGQKKANNLYKICYGQLDELLYSLDGMRRNASYEGVTKDDLVNGILGTSFEVSTLKDGKWSNELVTLGDHIKDMVGSKVDENGEKVEETHSYGGLGILLTVTEGKGTEAENISPKEFYKRFNEVLQKGDELRIDPGAWAKAQEDLPLAERSKPPGVYIETVHGVKGGEWDYVDLYMGDSFTGKEKKPEVNRKAFAIEPLSLKTADEYREEERRLAYVALTRPKKGLKIYGNTSLKPNSTGISPFLAEAGIVPGPNIQQQTIVIEDDATETAPEAPSGAIKTASMTGEYDYDYNQDYNYDYSEVNLCKILLPARSRGLV